MGNVFKAISDPTRREILKLLNDKNLINQYNGTSTSIIWIYGYFREKGVIGNEKND